MGRRPAGAAAGLSAADLAELDLAAGAEGVRLRVRVLPRGRRTELLGVQAGALKLRVAAPPVDGKANAAVENFLADRLGLAPGAVCIVAGATSRDKVVALLGLAPAELLDRLALP